MPKDIKESMKEVFAELMAMSPEEFKKAIEEGKKGDVAQILEEVGYFAPICPTCNGTGKMSVYKNPIDEDK